MSAAYAIVRLTVRDGPRLRALLDVFDEAFGEVETHAARRPSPEYLRSLLGSDTFIALVALAAETVVGGLTAYELRKYEQARSEIYIYDLAVAADYRRRGIATGLVSELRNIAAARGAHVIFVQADLGDEPAIALYTGLGRREDVLHFDIAVPPAPLESPRPVRPRELVEAWVEAFNRADIDALAALYAEDAINHQVAESPVQGRAAIREMFAAGFATATMVCIVENLFEDGEWAILEWRDPLGLRGCGFFHVIDGRIVFQRGYWDRLSFLRQHGLPLPVEP